MEDVRLTDGKGILTGNLEADVLYVGEESGIVSSLTVKLQNEVFLFFYSVILFSFSEYFVTVFQSRRIEISAVRFVLS